MNVLKTLRTLGCGVLVGTAGLKVLASADAKKVYTRYSSCKARSRLGNEDSNKHQRKLPGHQCRC